MPITQFYIDGNDWRLKFSQDKNKILEIYFGKDVDKVEKWYKVIQEIKNPIRKTKNYSQNNSFNPIQGLEEEKEETFEMINKEILIESSKKVTFRVN